MTDDAWTAINQDGYQAHVTITGADRSLFKAESDWIADYLARVDTFLKKWPVPWVEIWNEPNFGMWRGVSPAQKQLAYGNLLVAAYRHIKSSWPGVGVVGFGAGAASAAAPVFIRGVLGQVPAVAGAFDVCSLHPYIETTAPEKTRTESWGTWSISGQVAAIRAAGVRTPLWFTECGWQVSQADGGRYLTGESRVVSPHLQAAYRVRMFLLSLKLGVERLHHMYVVDTDNYNGGFFSNGAARPQARAFQVQQVLLADPWAVDTISDGSDDVYLYRVHTRGGSLMVAWSDSHQRVSVPSGNYVVVDLYGRQQSALTGVNPRLALSSAPTYIIPRQRATSLRGRRSPELSRIGPL